MGLIKPRYAKPRSYRYSLFDADGSFFCGYQQKPAAMTVAQRHGYGLFDHKEDHLVVACAVSDRIQALREQAETLEEEARQVRDKKITAEVIQEGEG